MELRLSLGTSSIEQLPTEILLQIFIAARTKIKKKDRPKYAHPDPNDAEGRLMTELVPRRALLCLARTCRRFRNVVDRLLAQQYEELEVKLGEHHRWEPLPREYFAFRRKQHLVRRARFLGLGLDRISNMALGVPPEDPPDDFLGPPKSNAQILLQTVQPFLFLETLDIAFLPPISWVDFYMLLRHIFFSVTTLHTFRLTANLSYWQLEFFQDRDWERNLAYPDTNRLSNIKLLELWVSHSVSEYEVERIGHLGDWKQAFRRGVRNFMGVLKAFEVALPSLSEIKIELHRHWNELLDWGSQDLKRVLFDPPALTHLKLSVWLEHNAFLNPIADKATAHVKYLTMVQHHHGDDKPGYDWERMASFLKSFTRLTTLKLSLHKWPRMSKALLEGYHSGFFTALRDVQVLQHLQQLEKIEWAINKSYHLKEESEAVKKGMKEVPSGGTLQYIFHQVISWDISPSEAEGLYGDRNIITHPSFEEQILLNGLGEQYVILDSFWET